MRLRLALCGRGISRGLGSDVKGNWLLITGIEPPE
jgi:hypothetical protein